MGQYIRSVGILILRLVLICPSCYTQSQKQPKKSNCSLLSHQYVRSFNWLMSLVSEQHKITNQCPHLYFVQPSERRSTTVWFMQIRQCPQSNENQQNSDNTRKFIWNTTLNRIHPLKVPLGNNVCWSGIRVCRDIIIWMSLKLWIKTHKISSKPTESQSSPQIFSIKVRVKINLICLSLNSLRIRRPVLMQSSKMYQTQCSLLERKKIVKTKESIERRVIYTKTTPLPSNNASTNNGQSTPQTSNHGPSPKRHLPPWQNIPNKRSLNHHQQNNNTEQPNKFTRLCITSVIQTTEKMHVYYNKEKRPSICVQITQQPSIRYVTHQMLYAMESHIYMWSVMHRLKNSSPNLQNKGQSSQNTPIVISIQIRGCRVSNQVVLHYILHGLFPLASAQFLKRSFHSKKKIEIEKVSYF